MSTALDSDSDPTYTHFGHRDEFLELLQRLLELDLRRDATVKEDEDEVKLVDQMGGILDYYLPLPGLLDPSLYDIVNPLMATLTTVLSALVSKEDVHISGPRLRRIGRVLNWTVKVRGWKAIVPHFPSTIPNLPILITLLSPPTSPSTSTTPSTPHHPLISGQEAWELRAVLLLWLALLLTVPFNLTALSPEAPANHPIEDTALRALFVRPISELGRQVALLALPLLHRPGKEGAYAALLLARLYSRSDTVDSLSGFLTWAKLELEEGERENEANLVASLFEFLALLPSLLAPQYLPLLEDFTGHTLLPHLRGSRTAAGSGLIRKLAVKACGRWWIARLGHRQKADASNEMDEMPEGLEDELDDLMNGLSDKDTIVRYSCAKYLARISSLLPASFAEQIITATVSLFAGTVDEPVVCTSFGVVVDPGGTASSGGTMGFGGSEKMRGEARWHGCCLAIAELARRGLVKDDETIAESVNWVTKALTFDLRKASHSIGANVRDAAAYLLWSLSRACSPSSLEPFAVDIATALISVACFDREVGVRRAASAAFQEGVGRLGLYPEGIDVLGKTDFYSVSVRRIAFSSAASAVAVHEVYRARMRKHLHHITLRHWDSVMRTLGAASLRDILALGRHADIGESVSKEIAYIPSLDPINVHGALVALKEVVSLLGNEDDKRVTILHSISSIRPATLVSLQGAEIIEAVCDLIAACLSTTAVTAHVLDQLVFHYLDLTMKRRESDVYEAVARMLKRLSDLRCVDDVVTRLLTMITSGRPIPRQVAALSLGHLRIAGCTIPPPTIVKALLGQLDETAKADVETRRYAIRSLTALVQQTAKDSTEPILDAEHYRLVFDALLKALADYSTDQRGDVGSWIRSVAIAGLGQAITVASRQSDCKRLVSQQQFQAAVGGMIKLGMEKLEPVRAASWRAWRLLHDVQVGEKWDWDGAQVWNFVTKDDSDESFRYIALRDWFSSAMPLLQTPFRTSLLSGVLHSVGSQVESVTSVAFSSLRSYLVNSDDTSKLVGNVLGDLRVILFNNINNSRIFCPAVTTTHRLLSDNNLVRSVNGSAVSSTVVAILVTSCRGMQQVKSIERISGVLKLVVATVSWSDPAVRAKSIDQLPLFLGHRFPRIRSMAAESLYLALSEQDDEIDPELEEVLLETAWTDDQVGKKEAEQVVGLLRAF